MLSHRSPRNRDHPPSSLQPMTNILLQLKQKKKQIMQQQSLMTQKIKQTFSDLTIQLQQKQSSTLLQFQNKIYNLLQSIDQYGAMSEMDLITNQEQIQRIVKAKLVLVENSSIKQNIISGVVNVCFNENQGQKMYEEMFGNQVKTSKKNSQKQFAVIKQSYMQQLAYLQQKIQKLTLKQQKIKIKISEMQSRQKMKKLGNAYLPSASQQKQKTTPNILIQRLQSQNKILKQQIADCSQKILSLRSQNSMLIKDKDCSQILQTEKKKFHQSIHLIQQSVQISQYQSKLSLLQSQIQNLKNQLQTYHKSLAHKQQEIQQIQSLLTIKQKHLNENNTKISQLTQYRARLQNECDTNLNKRIELQQKLEQEHKKYSQLSIQMELKGKEIDRMQEMSGNFSRLIKLKDQKICELDIENKKYQIKNKEKQDQYNKMYIQLSQKIQDKQIIIKNKNAQIENIKGIIKKQQTQKVQYRDQLAVKQQQMFNSQQKIRLIQADLLKANKQKQTYAKKEVNKTKKQMKKIFQQEKNAFIQDFRIKYGEFLQKLETLKKQMLDNKQRYEKKFKVYQNRMQLFKQKTTFQMKQMIDKISKPLKDKTTINTIIQSYIQNQSSLTLKNTQIKMLKEQLASLKKPVTKKQQAIKLSQDVEVKVQIQQFERKLFQQKLDIQKQLYQSRLLQCQQQYQGKLAQRSSQVQNLNIKISQLQKNLKQQKTALSSVTSNTQLSQLRKANQFLLQKQQKMESNLAGVKNNLNKLQNQCTQFKQEIKLKKQIINGLKKQLKDKQLQKSKLSQAMNCMMQEMDKMKRTNKQANKKQAIFVEFKDKLINQTQLSDQICQLRANLQDKSKQYRLQLNKKDQTIRQLRISEEILNKKIKNTQALQDQIIELKQKMKKMKMQIDRKDTLVDHLKQKHQKTSNQLATVSDSSQTELKKLKKQLQLQKSKSQNIKLKLNKTQTNYQLVKLAFIRVYQQFCSYQKVNNISAVSSIPKNLQYNTASNYKTDEKRTRYQFTVQKTPDYLDSNKYRQALSILQISSQDLQLYNNNNTNMYTINLNNTNNNNNKTLASPYSPVPCSNNFQSTANNGNKTTYQDSFKLTKLLQSQQIDSKAIVEIFTLKLDSTIIQ